MRTLRAETVFLLLALVFGTGFLVLTPPFQVPDEAFHLFRSWEISQGHLEEKTEAGQTSKEVPKSLVDFLSSFLHLLYQPREKTSAEEILAFRHKSLAPEDTQSYAFVSTSPHPSLPYLPQTIAMATGKALQLSPFSLFYWGRLLNFILWLLLVYNAVRIIPLFRWVLTVLALSPMSLHQAASLSPDAMANGLAFLLTALLLRLVLKDSEAPASKNIVGAAVISLCLTISKLVYLGHALLFLGIPRRKFSSAAAYFWSLGAVFAAHALAVWLLLHGEHFASRPETQFQSQWILHHPHGYLELLAKTFRVQAWLYIRQCIGIFGHLDTPLPRPLTLFYLVFLAFVVWRDRGEVRNLRGWERASLLGIALLEILAILSSIFITWTKPGASIVLGVQGRYFIPVLPLLLLPLYRPNRTGSEMERDCLPYFCLYGTATILTVSLFVLKNRFY